MAVLFDRKIQLLLVCFIGLSLVSSDGVFEVKLLRFTNDEGLDQTGKCCVNPDSSNCTEACRTAFRVCLTHYQAVVEQSPQCTFGSITTPVIGENSFNPDNSLYLKQHPINFKFSFRWPVSFSLVIDVIHEDANSTNQAQDQIGETIISRLVKSDDVYPVETGPNTWTRPEPYRHRQSVLQYEYRVVCDEDLYGPDCATFCHPRNDQFGHYDCNENGERECLLGWTKKHDDDLYCTKAVCSSCDSRRGICTAPETCVCIVGWSGEECSQCLTLPDCVHGTCDLPYQCKCDPGWGGSYCNQDLNYCTNNQPCRNGATCSNTGEGSYSCTCAAGFIGTDCQVEVNECVSQPCQNGAQCVDMINDYKCVCPAQFHGRNCESSFLSCADNPCLNEGTCSETAGTYSCKCTAEWRGLNCATPTNPCTENPCRNNGTCSELDTGYACLCTEGFSGTNCEMSRGCGDEWCLNGGSCLDAVTSNDRICRCRLCSCLAEYTGSRCERNIATNDSGQLSNSGSQTGIIYSKKTTTYIEENHSETRIIGVEQQDQSLSTTQWIAICAGAAVLVLLLIGSVVCLIYHKRRKYSTKTQHQYKEPTIELQNARSIDFSIVADHSSSESPIILERTFQKPLNAEICLSTSSFQQKAEKSSSADGDFGKDPRDRSHSRSSGKLPIVLSDGHCCKRYSHHYVQPIQEGVPCAMEEMVPLRRVSLGSSPMRHSNPESRPATKRDRYNDRPRSVRHSLTRPPTYEEVCREKDALIRNGIQQTNAIAI